MAKKKNNNTNILKPSGQVFVCGHCYDDFSDGGFDVFAICTTRENAKKKIAEEYNQILENWKNSMMQNMIKKPTIDDFEIRTMPLF